MATLFGRVYQIDIILTDGDTRTFDGFVNDPLQVTFQIDQTPNAERSYGQISIFGVNRETRRAIYEKGDQVRLVAGWRENFGDIFEGTIENVEIGRSGADTFITLFCQSAVTEFEVATVFKTFAPNTSQQEIIRGVAETFGFPVDMVGDYSDLVPALLGQTFASDTKSVMRKLSRSFQFDWMVLNNRTVTVRDNAARGDEPFRYSPDTGLIGSPEINAKFGVDVDVLLDPKIKPWDIYTVESTTASLNFNGVFYQSQEFPETVGESLNKALSMTHEGDFYSDTWQTSIGGILFER